MSEWRGAWEALAEATLKGRAVETLRRETDAGVVREPLYLRGDEAPPVGYPEGWPRVRGARTLDRRAAGWDVRQLHATGTVEEAAERIDQDSVRGVRSLHLALRPSTTAREAGIVAHALSDVRALLERVALAETPVAIEAGPWGPAYLGALLAVAREQGVGPDALTGAVHSDALGMLARGATLPCSLPAWWDAVAGMLDVAEVAAPWLHLVEADGLWAAEAGAHEALELAVTLASAVEALRQLERRGVTPERVARHLFVRLSVGCDQFMEIAKLRAARQLIGRLLEACGVPAGLCAPFVVAQAGAHTLTRRDAWTNLLRATAQGVSAAIGGADAITLLPHDARLGDPSQHARRQTATIQQVLTHEAHLARVADPAGGSWYVEAITADLAARAWALLQQIEGQDGLYDALTSGWLAAQIAPTRAARATRSARREDVTVGVNDYALADDPATLTPPTPPPVREDEVAIGPEILLASPGRDRMARAIDALIAGLPIDAIGRAMLAEDAPIALSPESVCATWRAFDGWEALRDRVEAADSPVVLLANIGPLARHTARAQFAARLAAAAGFFVIDQGGFTDPAEVVAAARATNARAVIICGHDDDYPEHVVPFATALTYEVPPTQRLAAIALAQRPKRDDDWQEALAAAGVTHHVYMGCDALGTLTAWADRILGADPQRSAHEGDAR